MARLRVNPTRMEMRNLERKLSIARRGHKLLKEKQDSMIQRFMVLSEEARIQRKLVDHELEYIYTLYQQASLKHDNRLIDRHLSKKTHDAFVDVKREYELGMRVLSYDVKTEQGQDPTRSVFALTSEVEKIERTHETLLPELIRLAELEKRCMILGSEIKDTRRRVNALEHRTVPDLQETIRYIKMRIDDNDRSQKARVMKVK